MKELKNCLMRLFIICLKKRRRKEKYFYKNKEMKKIRITKTKKLNLKDSLLSLRIYLNQKKSKVEIYINYLY